MSEDKLTFLDEQSEDEAMQPEAEAEAEAQVEEPQDPEAEAEAPEPEEAEAETDDTGEDAPPPGEDEGKQSVIPVTALLDEREKRQAAERQKAELEQRLKALEAQYSQAQQPQQKPDFFANPEGAIEQQLTQVKLQQSRFLAEREFGADVVNEAFEYFNEHPQESQALLQHPSPFHAAVEHYKRQKFLAEVNDPDQWREQERERIRQELLAEVQQQAAPSPSKKPPPSMSKAASSGRDALTPGSAFDMLLPD